MKKIKIILCALFMFTASNITAQEKGTKTEIITKNYKEGERFESKDFGVLTLVSERKIQGISTWKTKAEKEGKKRTIYVPLEYLENCKKID